MDKLAENRIPFLTNLPWFGGGLALMCMAKKDKKDKEKRRANGEVLDIDEVLVGWTNVGKGSLGRNCNIGTW